MLGNSEELRAWGVEIGILGRHLGVLKLEMSLRREEENDEGRGSSSIFLFFDLS